MKKCCAIPHEGAPPICPINGLVSKPVARITVESLVNPEVTLLSQPYYFCDDPNCDIVYVSTLGDHLITKDQLRVRVGLKEKEDPIPLCYCFGYERSHVWQDIRTIGHTDLPKIITRRVKAGECRCEVTNPSGNCCLGNVYRAVKQAEAMRQQGLL